MVLRSSLKAFIKLFGLQEIILWIQHCINCMNEKTFLVLQNKIQFFFQIELNKKLQKFYCIKLIFMQSQLKRPYLQGYSHFITEEDYSQQTLHLKEELPIRQQVKINYRVITKQRDKLFQLCGLNGQEFWKNVNMSQKIYILASKNFKIIFMSDKIVRSQSSFKSKR